MGIFRDDKRYVAFKVRSCGSVGLATCFDNGVLLVHFPLHGEAIMFIGLQHLVRDMRRRGMYYHCDNAEEKSSRASAAAQVHANVLVELSFRAIVRDNSIHFGV